MDRRKLETETKFEEEEDGHNNNDNDNILHVQHPRNFYQDNHYKDPNTNVASGGNSVDPNAITSTTTSTTTATTTTTTTTTTFPEEVDHTKLQQEQLPPTNYESQFPFRSSGTILSSAELFSSSNSSSAFDAAVIYSKPHYLTNQLKGTLWHDVNADGLRGSYLNSTLNAEEYDTGIGGVGNIALVHCNENGDSNNNNNNNNNNDSRDTIAQGSGVSQPNLSGRVSLVKRTTNPIAGSYQFPLSSADITPGRYYVLYQSPPNYRLTGNILPLDRYHEQYTESGATAYFDCMPSGGEGLEFLKKAKEVGDFDFPGYCARSIGCLEIGTRGDLEKKFGMGVLSELSDYLKKEEEERSNNSNTSNNDNNKSGGNDNTGTVPTMEYDPNELVVALPDPHMLDVGMAQDEWELPAFQFATVDVTVTFPPNVKVADVEATLKELLENQEEFRGSQHRQSVEKALLFALGVGGDDNTSGGGQDADANADAAEEQEGGEGATPDREESKSLSSNADSKETNEAEKFADSKEKNEAEKFTIKGLNLNAVKVGTNKTNKTKNDSTTQTTPSAASRFLRASRKLQQQQQQQQVADAEGGVTLPQQQDEEEMTQITYSLTARGSYRPPPHTQLGHIVQKSINADPSTIIKAFRDTQELPDFYKNVESVEGRHLSLGPSLEELEQRQKANDAASVADMFHSLNEGNGANSGMESWAFVPVIILAIVIGSLASLFLFRRVFVRRRKVRSGDDLPKTQALERDLMGTGFAVSGHDPEEDEMEKKKKGRRDKKHHRRSNSTKRSKKRDIASSSSSSSSSSSDDSDQENEQDHQETKSKRRSKQREQKNGSLSTSASSGFSGSNGSHSSLPPESAVEEHAQENDDDTGDLQEDLKTLESKEERRQRRKSRKKLHGDSSNTSSNSGGGRGDVRGERQESRFGSDAAISVSSSLMDVDASEGSTKRKKGHKKKSHRTDLASSGFDEASDFEDKEKKKLKKKKSRSSSSKREIN